MKRFLWIHRPLAWRSIITIVFRDRVIGGLGFCLADCNPSFRHARTLRDILDMVLTTVLVTNYLLLRRHHLLCGTNESPIGRLFPEMRRESDIVHFFGIVERL